MYHASIRDERIIIEENDMKHRLALLAMLACGGAATLPALAQDLKPGLWEMSSTISSADPQVQSALAAVQQHLANMSPEQRGGLERMMRQNGVQADLGQNGNLRTRVCMTREMIERKEFPVQQGDCRQTYTRLAADKGRIAFTCSKPRISGAGEITMASDTSYQAHVHVDSQESGKQSLDTDVNGRWLAADCGTLRPAPLPKTN